MQTASPHPANAAASGSALQADTTAIKDEPKPAPEPQAGVLRESPLAELKSQQTQAQQPMRSLALEFTPDGARDIKLRVAERAGDVHISVHGTDASLAGRLREGVSDLVGSLGKAGYEAEAWTPGQGHQGQRQPPNPRRFARSRPGRSGAEEFTGILQQPVQEIS